MTTLFDTHEDEPAAHADEPTSPIEKAKARIDGTLDYLTKYGAAPRRAQIVQMLRELSNDLGRLT